MSTVDPIRNFATDVVRQLTGAGHVALWAGGCVRDLMLKRVPDDYDVATDARPEQVRKLFGRRRTLAVGESFGVIIVLGPNKPVLREGGGVAGQVEVATFRTEGEYTDGRRPDRVEYCTPEEDARRRDFTINGMFYDPLTETVHDYVGGEQDLRDEIVRAIGNPRDRMSEDKLRMLRAARFAATLDFQLDETTAAAIRDMAGEILLVSWERIAQELKKMLIDPHRERAMCLCHELGLLEVILPELSGILTHDSGSDGHVASHTPHPESRTWLHTRHMLDNLQAPGFELAMAALLHSVPSPPHQGRRSSDDRGTVRAICRRLKLSNLETDRVCWLVAHRHALDDSPSLDLATLKRLLSSPLIGELFQLARRSAQVEQRGAGGIDFAADYLARTPAEVLDPPQLITGTDLQTLGLTPGPQFKEILTAVRDAQLNEQIATHEEALQLAQQRAT